MDGTLISTGITALKGAIFHLLLVLRSGMVVY
jgi:hypothetical protein